MAHPDSEDYRGEDPADYPALCCHLCEGTGEIVDGRDRDITCPECGGSGWPHGMERPFPEGR